MAQHTTEIRQTTAFNFSPVGQEMILIVASDLCVANEQNVKFCCTITVFTSNLPASETVIGTFKTTPNNAGVGIFDIRSIIENTVSVDNLAAKRSTWKQAGNRKKLVPMHIIDKFSLSPNSIKYCQVEAYTEFTDADGVLIETDTVFAFRSLIFNGYVKHNNLLKWVNPVIWGDAQGFGFEMSDFAIMAGTTRKLLSNSPSTQWAGSGDYGTMSYIAKHSLDGDFNQDVRAVRFTLYDEYDAGGVSSGTVNLYVTAANAAFDATALSLGGEHSQRILQFGAFPANVKTWSDTFNTELAGDLKSYTIGLYDGTPTLISEEKIVNILCPNLKGFEQVRLGWLNQWGTWDYYTFNQKSVKTISTKGTTYDQLEGTWNDTLYEPYGYKGGKKSFRVNATEKIKMNTDFVTEEHSDWFEELINSPEVYIIKGWESPRKVTSVLNQGEPFGLMSQYATPVRLTTTSFTKKTIANDKLIQYTFEVEKSKTLRTQAI